MLLCGMIKAVIIKKQGELNAIETKTTDKFGFDDRSNFDYRILG